MIPLGYTIIDLCDEFGLQPSQVYRWLEQLLGNAASALDARGTKRSSAAKTNGRSRAPNGPGSTSIPTICV